MSRTRQDVKKQAKAITRRRLGAKERHERQQKRAQRDIEALHQALDDLGLPDEASIIASATLESALWTSRSGRQID